MRVYSCPYANNIYHLSIDCLIDNLTVRVEEQTWTNFILQPEYQSPLSPLVALTKNWDLNCSFKSKNYLFNFLLNNSSFVIIRLIRRSEEKGEEKEEFANKRL